MDDLAASDALAKAAADLVDAAGAREAARILARACMGLGAEGAEVWRSETAGWRRLAAEGDAVLGHVLDPASVLEPREEPGYPGPLAVIRSGDLAVAFRGGLPGTDAREAVEGAVEALLTTCAALEVDLGADDEPIGPSSLPDAA